MTKKFKLNFQSTNRGFLRANFKDRNGEDCSIQESSVATEECIWLGQNNGTHHHVTGDCLSRMHLTRDMVGGLIPALVRFYRFGTLAELPATEQLAGIAAAFDEEEEHYNLIREVARLAGEFIMWKNEYHGAITDDGCDPAGAHCLQLQSEICTVERALDDAVEALEVWKKEHGWKESEAK